MVVMSIKHLPTTFRRLAASGHREGAFVCFGCAVFSGKFTFSFRVRAGMEHTWSMTAISRSQIRDLADEPFSSRRIETDHDFVPNFSHHGFASAKAFYFSFATP